MRNGKYYICSIVPDEKFIDGAIEGLDLYSNKWDIQWIVCQDVNKELKLIKRHTDRIYIITENKVLDYITENNFDAVFIHSLGIISPFIIQKIPDKMKVFWFGWGYDIYNFPDYKPFLKKKTKYFIWIKKIRKGKNPAKIKFR